MIGVPDRAEFRHPLELSLLLLKPLVCQQLLCSRSILPVQFHNLSNKFFVFLANFSFSSPAERCGFRFWDLIHDSANNLDRILTCNFVVLGREGPKVMKLSLEDFRTMGFVPVWSSTRFKKVEVSTIYKTDELQNET